MHRKLFQSTRLADTRLSGKHDASPLTRPRLIECSDDLAHLLLASDEV